MSLPVSPIGARVPLDLGPGSLYPFVNGNDVAAPPPPSAMSVFVGGSVAQFAPDPFGARAAFTPPLIPTVRFADQMGQPFIQPSDPFGARSAGVYFTAPTPPQTIAGAAGVPFVPPPDPFGARASFTPPLIPTVRFAVQDGNGPVFPPDPFIARGYGTYFRPAPQTNITAQAGIPFVPPPDPYGARSFFTPPLIPTVIIATTGGNRAVFPDAPYGAIAFTFATEQPPRLGMSAGNRAVFPPDAYGARAYMVDFFVAPIISQLPLRGGSGPVFPDAPYGATARFVIPLLPTRNYLAVQAGSAYKGDVERGYSFSRLVAATLANVVLPNQGGGGEWIIWGRPDFPANDRNNWRRFDKMPFRKPTRRVP